MTNLTKVQIAKKCKGFKVPNSEIVWTPGNAKDYGIEGTYETMEIIDGEEECLVTTRWFTEGDLKDVVFFP